MGSGSTIIAPTLSLPQQLEEILNARGPLRAEDFDGMVYQAKGVSGFDKLLRNVVQQSPSYGIYICSRIERVMTRQEAASFHGIEMEEAVSAERYFLTSLKNYFERGKSLSVETTGNLNQEVMPVIPGSTRLENKLIKSDPVTGDVRADKVRSLCLNIIAHKGESFLRGVLNESEIRVVFDLILKNLPITREYIYPKTGLPRIRLLKVLIALAEKLDAALTEIEQLQLQQ